MNRAWKCMVLFAMLALASTVLAAEPTITLETKLRYPWNGLVDLHFTITGTSGTKYDTSFTAKDLVGGTNVTMRTIRKSNGVAANATKEQLLPGNYKWVWDAAADLPEDWNCARMIVTGKAEYVDPHGKVQLWAGGPYWAKTNIGAENSYNYGYYFWWGDTIGYKRVNSKWVASNGSSSDFSFESKNARTYGKDISTLKSQGWIDSNNVLVPAHDAAHVHWGGGWRMPKETELDDLLSKCSWSWSTQNGVKGYIVKGKGNYASASIFLPCSGYTSANGSGAVSLSYVGSRGYYWSSVPTSDYGGHEAYTLRIFSNDYDTGVFYARGYLTRERGNPVRPVQDP